MIKFLLAAAAVVGLFFLTPAANNFKASIVSVVNPASSERQSLSDLQQHLSAISKTISQPAFQNLSTAQKTSELKTMLNQATGILDQAQQTAQKTDIAATISTIAHNVLPQSWTSAPSCTPAGQ